MEIIIGIVCFIIGWVVGVVRTGRYAKDKLTKYFKSTGRNEHISEVMARTILADKDGSTIVRRK